MNTDQNQLLKTNLLLTGSPSIMNQNVLTTFSIVSIKYLDNQQQFYLTNKSFVRDNVYLASQMSAKDYENSLFYIETDSNQNQIKSALQFGEKVVFRHKISNKYLTHSDEFEQEENDTTYKLRLSHNKHHFKILPCFQYQTKISSKIRFNEDVYLVTQISGAKTGYLSSKKTENPLIRNTILGINQHNSISSSKFSFHNYYEREKDEQSYTYGSIVWISHIESSTFMSCRTIKNKKQLTFEQIQYEKDLQSISGLWLIQSHKFIQGGRIKFQSKFRLKNLSTGAYMSFSGNFKMNQNERAYSIILQNNPTEKSEFVFRSLKGDDNQIRKNSYLILRHDESKLFIGCRKNNYFQDTEIYKPISTSQFSDEDLFKIIELGENEDEALRFVLSLSQQLSQIQGELSKQNGYEKLNEDKQVFLNIKKQLQKLKKFDKLFQKVQGQTGQYIPILCELLAKYRSKIKRDGPSTDKLIEILKLLYEILVIVSYENRKNQQNLSTYLPYFVEDIFYNLGAQNLIIEIYRNNYKVLCRASKPLAIFKNKNIIQVTIEMIERFSKNKDNEYWQKLLKIMQLFFVLISDEDSSIDINQRIVSEQFFGPNQMFIKIFFGIKIIHNRIKVEEQKQRYIQIDRIRNPLFISVIQEVFKLLSLLSYHRNFISKKSIHQFLSQGSENNIQIMIAYLNMPITEKLCNSLYLLLTNLYIDSSPRIDREKPLSVINFSLVSAPRSVQEEHEMTDKLKTQLLDKLVESYSSKPLLISNLLLWSAKISMEPTLSHEELALYKEQLNQKLKNNICSVDLLKSVVVLIRLQSYTEPEIVDIFKTLVNKLSQPRNKLSSQTVKGIMKIILEISIFRRQIELKKMSAYLKYKYRMQQLTINYQTESEYLLPYDRKLMPSVHYPQDINQSISSYNHEVDLLRELWPNKKLSSMLLNLLISKQNEKNMSYLQQIYNTLVSEAFHKKMFIELIIGSIVVTSEESATFEALFQLYKKLKHLTAISEYWLIGSGENKENMKSYVKYLIEVINYVHQSYQGNTEYSARQIKIQNDYTGSIVKESDIYVNRQLLLRNIGFHKLVLQLLQSNYFLLQVEYSDDKKVNLEAAKAHQIFSLCFQFIYGFIYNCRETKQIIHKAWNILDKFQNLPQVGQTRIYRELYKNKIEYIRQIKKNFIERIINKILKNPKSKNNEGCEFNPQFLRYLQSIVKINGVSHASNFQKLYRVLEKQSIFKKILYCTEQGDGKVELCLDIFQIKTDCVQIPFIYHIKILGLICDMADGLDSQSTIIKSKLRNTFNFNYLIRILAGNDIYSHTGLQAKMRFLLKKQIMRIVMYYIERNDSIHVLHENIELLNLLQFYYKIFVERPKKIKQELLNEALYLPYFQEYEEQVEYLENNQRKYFQEQIVPFLQKISAILKKTQKSIINSKINQILQEYDDKKMVEFFEYRKMGKLIDQVELRWLNFVDRDENNSPEQKFAKLSIVDLLRSSQSKKALQNQNEQFSKLISEKTVEFIDVMIRLISMNMEQQHKENQSHTKFVKIYNRLVLVREVLMILPTKEKKQQQITFLLQRGIIENFINFTIKLEFDYSKTIVRKIFHEIIKIFIFILSNSSDSKPLKQIYRVVNEQQLCFRFWSHLSESILTISEDTHIEKPLNQVNWCLSNIYLNGEVRDENIYEQSLIFLQELCQYSPFTNFLRYQPMYPTKDFLEILHHILNFILLKEDKTIKVNVSTVEASQKVLNCIIALMHGRNQANQNYVVDSKLPELLSEILKLQKLKIERQQADDADRQRLVGEVIQFYEKNGIDLSKDLRHKISVLDFNHPYILNRLKYMLLRTIVQAIAGNERGMSKLKFQISIELIKINLIWVFEQFKSQKLQYKQELVMKELYQWETIINVEDLNGTFLMVGFYLYYLVEFFGEESDNKNEDQDNSAQDKQKRKQKLVNKFFRTISEKDKKKQKLQKLNNEPFAEQMKIFFESYYEALDFFKGKTLSIEVNFHDELTKIFFPKLPICDKMNDEIIQQFKTDAVRISQEQKIKSLLQFEQQCYDRFSGEEKFINDVHSVFPFVAKWFNIFTEQRLRLAALVSCFIQTLLFLIQNFLKPNFIFHDTLLISPASELEFIMFIIGILNLVIAAHIFFALIFKKSPILYTVLSEKQRQRDEKQREKFMNGRNAYLVKNIFPEIASSLIYIIFLLLSFIHPFFGSFILFDVMNRLQLGRQIFKSVKQTWFQLLMATILLIMFNYLFALYLYIQFSPFYAPACQILFQCLLLLVDQSLKSGSGFYGTTPPLVEEYIGLKFDLGFFSEMIYIIFAQKVMFEIFAGTIIDKFSQLREQAEQVEEDEKTNCYICGQERFVIDFQLEGFETHIEQTHNPINYIYYLFYLRKQNIREYGIVDKFVNDCQRRKKKHWIPNETSILKQQKEKEKEKQNEESEQLKLKQYLEKKSKESKQIRTKIAMIVAELKMENSRSKS